MTAVVAAVSLAALAELGCVVGMLWAETLREQEAMWRQPWASTVGPAAETPDVAGALDALPPARERLHEPHQAVTLHVRRLPALLGLTAEPAPDGVELVPIGARHPDVAPAVVDDDAPIFAALSRALLTPTQQFAAIVDATWTETERETLSQEWWCEECLLAPVAHLLCDGCACPCSLVAVRRGR